MPLASHTLLAVSRMHEDRGGARPVLLPQRWRRGRAVDVRRVRGGARRPARQDRRGGRRGHLRRRSRRGKTTLN
jgi:hypothetical protein